MDDNDDTTYDTLKNTSIAKQVLWLALQSSMRSIQEFTTDASRNIPGRTAR